MNDDLTEHIRQSNLIEGVTGEQAVAESLKAWRYLSAQQTLSLDVILECHRLVMLRLWPQIAGKLRTVGVQVGGRLCPRASEVPELLRSWLDMMRTYADLDPRAMHIEFEHIHPFRDGNGRVGRLLMWWHEERVGPSKTLVAYEDRYDYYDWFDLV